MPHGGFTDPEYGCVGLTEEEARAGQDITVAAVPYSDLDRAVMPGALTPTEVIAAWNSGADLVKVFPCSAVGGAKYLRALRAPLPDVKLMPTGGVNLSTLEDYLAAGAAALGVGSALVDLGLLEREGAPALTAHAERYVDAVRAARTRTEEGR